MKPPQGQLDTNPSLWQSILQHVHQLKLQASIPCCRNGVQLMPAKHQIFNITKIKITIRCIKNMGQQKTTK